ncbi:LysR family transcriptional regulator [Pseudomonas sp. BN411]|uniref:LysR family transcriptional regulator n=1 Tax=Pseudomonas sp. BN411 TaxID=2567887 RepID=UPI0024568713|nr:LysR family transcriptional regulator [Pseudomonas sp. BN411]MDH4559933.1 LysR family transcriptional regulator [Pseudomonas sp. BN411]
MRFHGLDLNLLVVLDALFVEQHVTRAAARLHLTQSAVSAALGRLREHFNDPLFVLVGGSMLPTALMQGLHPRIQAVLESARDIAFSNIRFEPGETRRRFRILASDYVIAVLMPALLGRLASLAPQVDLQLLTLVPRGGVEPGTGSLVDEALEHRHCDLVILPHAHGSSRHPQQPLFEDGFSVIACAENPGLAEGLTMERYLAAPHVVRETGPGAQGSMEAEFLASHGLERRVAVAVEQFGLIPEFVVGGPCISTLHSRLARLYARRFPLRLLAPPLAMPPTLQVVQWHAYQDSDPALAWLRGLLAEVAA